MANESNDPAVSAAQTKQESKMGPLNNDSTNDADEIRVIETTPAGAAVPGSDDGKASELSNEAPMGWYILKVQSNREDSVAASLLRRARIYGLQDYFGQIVVPTESVTELKNGKRRTTKRKLYPGYIIVNMIINDDTWYLVRQTSGIGDFAGTGGKPTEMLSSEVERILAMTEKKVDDQPVLKIGCKLGDRVKIKDGNFESFEGEVDAIDSTNGRVTVMINIFGRSTPVQLEYWQIELI